MNRAVQVLFVVVCLVFPVWCPAENLPPESTAESAPPVAGKKIAPAKKLISLETDEGRAVLGIDGHVENLKYFELQDPARLVVDLPGVVPTFAERSFSASEGFKGVRIGPGQDKTRIVFDASDSLVPAYNVQQLGQKIVIAWAVEPVAGEGTVGSGVATKAATAVPEPTELEKMRQYLAAEQERLAQQQKKFSEEEAKYLAQRQELKRSMAEQQHRIEEMQQKLGLVKTSEGQPKKPVGAKVENAPTRIAKADTAAKEANQPPAKPVGRPPEKDREQAYKEIEAIFERQGVLTPRGKFVLEPSLQYTYISSTRVALIGYTLVPAITVGLIDVRSVNRNSFVGALAARYGLTNRFEVELKVPYVYRDDSTSARSINTDPPTANVFSADGNDLGDIEFGFRYQINMPNDNSPIFIGGLRIKSDTGTDPFDVPVDPETGLALELPTGSGFWGINPSFTAIVPSDPAVFFGSVSYLYNIERDISGYGEIDLGDTISANVGVGYGINEKASFSLGYEHSIILKTKQDGEDLEDSITQHVGCLLLGGSYRLTDNTNLNFSLSGGLTEAAPDVQLTLRMPMTF